MYCCNDYDSIRLLRPQILECILPGQEVGEMRHTRGKDCHIQDILNFDDEDRKTIDRGGVGGHQEEGKPPMFSVWPSPG